jgi:hypothetical protein
MTMKLGAECDGVGQALQQNLGSAGSAFCNDWRCQQCRRLLGKDNGAQLQIRYKPLDYIVGFPVCAICPGCGALNARTKA